MNGTKRRGERWRSWGAALLALSLAMAALFLLLEGTTQPVVATPPVEGNPLIFGEAEPVLTPTAAVRAMAFADLTGDGAGDLLYAEGAAVRLAAGEAFTLTTAVGSCTGTVTALDVADLDGDGDPDVAAFCEGEVRLWRNDGTGWTSAVLTGSGTYTDGLLADLDGDARPDAAALGADGSLHLWRNGGDPFGSVWTTTQALPLGGEGRALVAADFNRDGRLDLAAAVGNGVRLWQGPDAPFAETWSSLDWAGAGEPLRDLASAELSGDALPDLAAVDAAGRLLGWAMPFTAGGSFIGSAAPVELGSLGEPLSAVVLADFDRDGRVDAAAVGGDGPFTATVWRHEGSWGAAWTTRRPLDPPAVAPLTLLAADDDRDGDIDLLCGGAGTLFRRANASLHRAARFRETDYVAVADLTADVEALAAGDLDRDGRPDLVSGDADGRLLLWKGPPESWTAEWTPTTIGEGARVLAVALLDADGDGALDLASGHDAPPYLRLWHNPGDGSGNWESVEIAGPQRPVAALAVADFDHDGRPDLACGTGETNDAPSSDHGVLLWHNDGDPWTGNPTASVAAVFTYPVNALAAGDLDRDGLPDLVAGTDHAPSIGTPDDPQTGTWPLVWEVMAMRNPGAPFAQSWPKAIVGRDAASITLSLGHYHGYWGVTVYDVRIADLDGDGWLDVETADHVSADYQVKVWRNDGTPFDEQPDHFHWTWEPTAVWYGSRVPWMGGSAMALAVADFTMDARPDLMPGIDLWQRIWFVQDGPPFGETLTDTHWEALTFGVSAERVQQVVAADFDGDGDEDIAVAGKVWDGPEVAIWRNGTGEVTLDSFPTDPPPIQEGAMDDVLRITFADNGLSGEESARLLRLRLRFTTPDGAPMPDLSDRVSRLWLYRDTGNHRWATSDTPVYTLTAPAPDANGYLTLTLPEDEPHFVVGAEESCDYFIVVEAAAGAMNSVPNAFHLFFDGDADGLAAGATSGAALSIQDTEPTDSGLVTVVGPPTSVFIESADDGTGEEVETATVALGYQRTFHAVSRDALGHFVAAVPVTWGMEVHSGGIISTDLVPCLDERCATFHANAVGTASILITHTTLGTDTLPLLHVTASPMTISLEAEPETLIADGVEEASVRAQVLDLDGQPVADGTPVTFTLLSSTRYGQLLPGSPYLTETTGGVATATVRAGTTAGAVEVQAETGGITAVITLPVRAGAAVAFRVEGYTTWTPAGAPLYTGPRVTVLDAFENVKTDYTGTVHFLSSDPRAALSYTLESPYTFTVEDAGVHWFPGEGFVLYTAGDRWLTVTDGLITETFGPIEVRPALEPYTIVLSLSTEAITTGLPVTATTVAFDRYGNSKGDWTAGCTFSIEPEARGEWISPNVYLPGAPGRWTITAQAVMSPRPVDTATLTVLPSDLVYLPLVMRSW